MEGQSMSAISSQELKAVIFASAAEQSAAPTFIAAGCVPCQTFAPHFQTSFTDKLKETFTAKPDFYHAASNTFFELKSCALNPRQSIKAARNRLKVQYEYHFDASGAGLTHDQLSSRLWASSKWRKDCLNHAFNHALHKHLIIQKALGRENYIVVFDCKLTEEQENNYHKKGLLFIYLKDLAAFLTVE